jgi:hypothetical protein
MTGSLVILVARIRKASAETSKAFLASISSSIGRSLSLGGMLPSGITNSAAAMLQRTSNCQSSGVERFPPRCRTSSATSGKSVCAISCAIVKRTRARGCVGLYWITSLLPLDTILASATLAFASTGILSKSAILIGSNGGPLHPESRARNANSRAFRSITAIGSSFPASLSADLFVHRMPWGMATITPFAESIELSAR